MEPTTTIVFGSKRHNGGYGDRLVGMASAYTIAKILDAKFLVDWDEEYCRLCEHTDYFFAKGTPVDIHLNIVNAAYSSVLAEQDIRTAWKGKTVYIQMNKPLEILLWKNPFITDINARSYEHTNIQSYKRIFSTFMPIRHSLQDMETYDGGVQIRCGDTFCMPHSAARQYIPTERFSEFAASVKEYLRKRGIKGKIYITSDARVMYTHFKALCDDDYTFHFWDRTDDIHFDYVNSRNRYAEIVRDHMSLQRCRHIITSLRSNFGTSAAYCSPICTEMILYSLEPDIQFFTVYPQHTYAIKEYDINTPIHARHT